MSNQMTDVSPRGDVEGYPNGDDRWFGMGYASHGRKTRAEMIATFRDYYEQQKSQAELALSLTDDQLIVTTYTGVHAQRAREEVTE